MMVVTHSSYQSLSILSSLHLSHQSCPNFLNVACTGKGRRMNVRYAYIVFNSCKAKSCILLGYLLPSFHLSWLVPLQTWPGIGVMFYPFQGPLGSLGFIVQNLSTLQHMYKVLQATHIIHYLLLTLKRTWFERSRPKSSKVFGLLLPLLNRKKQVH